jgi:hypothetical protein
LLGLKKKIAFIILNFINQKRKVSERASSQKELSKSAKSGLGVLDEPYSAKPAQQSCCTGPPVYIG